MHRFLVRDGGLQPKFVRKELVLGRRTLQAVHTTEGSQISAFEDIAREMQELELELLREGIQERTAGRERCRHCGRTPLIGERVYRHPHGTMVCQLCRSLESDASLTSQLMHGPAFGHTIRVIDQRAA
jgi:hypothetical protein